MGIYSAGFTGVTDDPLHGRSRKDSLLQETWDGNPAGMERRAGPGP